MSFRRFVYFCAVCGAWSAFAGWMLGSLLAPAGGTPLGDAVRAALLGGFLGLSVALGLSLLESLGGLSAPSLGAVLRRAVLALVVGSAGGVAGAFVGQLLYGWTQQIFFFLVGWTVVGLLVGASVGSFDLLAGWIGRQEVQGARKKLRHCLLGGFGGGLLGGGLALVLRLLSTTVFPDKDQDRLLSPTALGFVALGACIGLLIGLAQVILKEAWIRVEAGFRPGREMILAKNRISIGRGEGADIALFGDPGIEKQHAYIIRRADRYFLEEAGPTQGTFVNNQRIAGSTPLSSGDLIRLGRSTLRFSERRKQV
jgi:hypothetical protein